METQSGDFSLANFQFHNGEVLSELNLHYTTLGEPCRDEAGLVRNAVLILHGTGGSGQNFLSDNFAGTLFGKGQLLDAEDYYIILPDGVGHGQSSKPSDGLRTKFPQYRYADMVLAQYRLVTEGLDINHLRLVMGTSMGGMQTWMWGQTYPDFMDCLLPLASLPAEIAGRNRMIRRMILDAIRTDPEWQNGDYIKQPSGLKTAIYMLLFMTSSPLQWQKEAATGSEADRFLEAKVQDYLSRLDANDMLYQFASSQDYNPLPRLSQIKAPLLAINSADDQVNPPELGLMEAGIEQVERGHAILLPISDETRGHGTHSLPILWQHHLAAFLADNP
jgi:homoserine O-acetyltransferase/O-succinyltransferase